MIHQSIRVCLLLEIALQSASGFHLAPSFQPTRACGRGEEAAHCGGASTEGEDPDLEEFEPVSLLQQRLEVVDPEAEEAEVVPEAHRPLIYTNTNKKNKNEKESVRTVFEVEDREQLVKDSIQFARRATAQEAQFLREAKLDGRSVTEDEIQTKRIAADIAESADFDVNNFTSGTLRLFNPSILEMPPTWRQPGERWIALFRFANYKNSTGPNHNAGPRWYSSYLALTTLDSQLRPLRPIRLLGSKHFFDEPFDCHVKVSGGASLFGPEDGRLFLAPGDESASGEAADPKVLVFFSGRAHSSDMATPCKAKGGQRMYVSELGPELLPRWTSPLLVPGESSTAEVLNLDAVVAASQPDAAGLNPVFNVNTIFYIEKNWAPFLYRPQGLSRVAGKGAGSEFVSWGDSALLAEYSFDPHIVFDINVSSEGSRAGSNHIWSSSNPELVKQWIKLHKIKGKFHPHVGVSAVRLKTKGRPDVFLSVMHGFLEEYYSFLYTFEAVPPFRILGIGDKALPISNLACLWGAPVSFPMGLSLELAAPIPEMWILYGRGDLESHRLRLSWKDVEEKRLLPAYFRAAPGLTLVMVSKSKERLDDIKTILRKYRSLPGNMLEEIVFIWNDPSDADTPREIQDLNVESKGVTLRVVHASVASRNNRFAIWSSIGTDGVILQDDDMWLNKMDLHELIGAWQMNNKSLVGAASELVYLKENQTGSYLEKCRKVKSKCTLLPRPWVVATEYLQTYMEAESMASLMDGFDSCEDIYFNGIVQNATRLPPVAILVDVHQLPRKAIGGPSQMADAAWVLRRAACVQRVNRFFEASQSALLSDESSAHALRGFHVAFAMAAFSIVWHTL